MDTLPEILNEISKKVRFGQVTLSLQLHNSKFVGLIGNEFLRRIYKDDGMVEAVKEFLDVLEKAREKEKYGTLSVSFRFDKGKLKEMLIQDNFKKILK